MAKILILGGTKFFGLDLVEKLLSDGHEITIISRVKKLPEQIIGKITHLCHDLSFKENETVESRTLRIAEYFNNKQFEIVVDNISGLKNEVSSTIQALMMVSSNIKQYVYCSSVVAYSQWNKGGREEIKEDEIDLQTKGYSPDIFSPEFQDIYKIYAEGKRESEKEVIELCNKNEIYFTIMRPVVVEGPNDPFTRTWFWIQRLLDKKPILIPDTFPETIYKHVYSQDVSEAFRLAINNPKAYNQSYNIAGEEIFTVEEYLYKLANILKIPRSDVNIIAVNPSLIASEIEGFEFPVFFSGVAFLSNIDKAKADLGYRPLPVDEWLRLTVNWYLDKQNEGQFADSFGYQNREKEELYAKKLLKDKKSL